MLRRCRKLQLSKPTVPALALLSSVADIFSREQKQFATENSVVAAAAAAAVSGSTHSKQNNAENLLDIDTDGTVPAPLCSEMTTDTAQGIASPRFAAAQAPNNNLDDLVGVFGTSSVNAAATDDDLMNGFASLNFDKSPPQGEKSASQTKPSTSKDDIMSLF